MGHSVCGLSSGIRASTLWLGFNLCCVDPLTPVVMDREQSLIIPLLFDGTNYVYWKVRIRAFLQFLDEKVWQAGEIGWTKLKEAPADWDEAKIKGPQVFTWARAWRTFFNRVPQEAASTLILYIYSFKRKIISLIFLLYMYVLNINLIYGPS